MYEDPKDPSENQEHQPELDDEAKLDDLDPEEEGEDVLGGGAPFRGTSNRSNYV
jgi:hypothetical protein